MKRPSGRIGATRAAELAGRAAWRGLEAFLRSDNLTYAASIAYYTLLSLFPFFLLVFAIVGRATAEEGGRRAVLTFVLRYFPRQFHFLTEQLDALRSSGFTFGVAGTIALVWGALGAFGEVSAAVNHAWGVDERPSFLKHRLVAGLMLGVAALVFLFALLLIGATHLVGATPFAEVVAGFPGLVVLRGLTVRYATTLLFIIVVGMIFYFVPNAPVRFRDVWPGAILTGILWKLAFEAFSWLLRDLTIVTRVDGSIAAVVAFLVWVYVQAAILLYGAGFTAAFGRLLGDIDPEARPPERA